MLARRSTFRLKNGRDLHLPLLIPAFSSKGFPLRHTGKGPKRRRYSEVALELVEFGRVPNKAVLVSAYDIHHKHFSAPKTTTPQQTAYLTNTEIVFLDSGGYELASDFDSVEPRIYDHRADDFSRENYEVVLAQLAKPALKPPLVIANYDHGIRGQTFETQIKEARRLFVRFSSFGSDFILKPWSGTYIDPSELSPSQISELRGFDIIGIAEKDLGKSLMQRLARVAQLRTRLNEADIDTPIHVWGGLEPVATPLFFFAGAEIFDGISWLRYAFKHGFAVVRETYCVVSEIGVTASHELNHRYAGLDNRRSLERLEIALQQWVDMDGQDFTAFPEAIRSDLQKAYGAMMAQIPELAGAENGRRRRK